MVEHATLYREAVFTVTINRQRGELGFRFCLHETLKHVRSKEHRPVWYILLQWFQGYLVTLFLLPIPHVPHIPS